jgi:hypothetical protein
MNMLEERAALQLAALADVSARLQQASIDYWLFGGWAVDFYVGSVTRAHDDVDLAVWVTDAARIASLLLETGWRHAPLAGEDGGTGFERAGVRLELTYLQSGAVEWPGADGLADDVGELRGVRSRLIGLAALLQGKSAPRDDPEDAVKDRADFRHLSRLRA